MSGGQKMRRGQGARASRRVMAAAAIAGGALGMNGAVYGGVINFDDFPVSTSSYGEFLAGHQGFDWSNFYTVQKNRYGDSGYQSGVVSESNVAFNGHANAASVARTTPFTLGSGYFTAAWKNGLVVTVQGYRSGGMVFQTSFTVDFTGAQNKRLVNFNWPNLDSVTFTSAGGTNIGYGDGEHFVVDNLALLGGGNWNGLADGPDGAAGPSGNWSTGANWGAFSEPGTTDDVIHNLSSDYTVTMTSNTAAAKNFTRGGGGTVTLTGGGKLTLSETLFVGRQQPGIGGGNLTVAGGTRIDAGSGYNVGIGFGSSASTLRVTGAGSAVRVITAATDFSIGQSAAGFNGDGTLVVENGGRVESAGQYVVGVTNGDHGRIDVNAGGTLIGTDTTWSGTSMFLGGYLANSGGHGQLNVNGGHVEMAKIKAWNNGYINLSAGTLKVGSLEVTGGSLFEWTGGTLQLTGGSTNFSIEVPAGGTLRGSGTIFGHALYSSGMVAPGNSAGTLTVGEHLHLFPGAGFSFDLGSVSDLIVADEGLNGSNAVYNFHFTNAGDFSPGTYTLITYEGTGFTPANFSYTSDIPGFSGNFVVGSTSLQFIAVPEPASVSLVALGGLAALTRKRRRPN